MKCFPADSDLQTSTNSKFHLSDIHTPTGDLKFQIQKKRWNSDDLSKYCPIDIPNAFQYDKMNGQKFNLFLEGQYSPNELVKDMNLSSRRQQLSKIEQEVFKKNEIIQYKKDLTGKRYDKVRLVINQNIKLRESLKLENNLKDSSRMFQQLNNYILDHQAKIKAKDLLTSRTDGNRQHKFKKLYEFNKSGIKLKFNIKKTKNDQQIEDESKQALNLQLQDQVDDFFEKQQLQQQNLETRQKRKAKLTIVADRKEQRYFTEFDSKFRKSKATPSLKDVQLYKYIHGNQLNQQFPFKSPQHQKSYYNKSIKNRKTCHILSNFNKPDQMYTFEEYDQSFESMKEMKLSNLYAQSIDLQKKLLVERKLVNQVSQSKQIDDTTNLIQLISNQKLQ